MTFADGPRSPCTDRRPYRGVAHGYRAVGSAGGAGEAGRNDVGSVPIQRNTGAVIPHSGPRVTVRGGFLNVAQRHAGVEGCRENVRRVCGLIDLPMPARLAVRRTIRLDLVIR